VENLIYEDLLTPSYIKRCRDALSELTNILELGDIYPFQCK
jgi:succinylarginine dihydrolase